MLYYSCLECVLESRLRISYYRRIFCVGFFFLCTQITLLGYTSYTELGQNHCLPEICR